ncbi:HCP-like protein [Chaetoceros tenuissimus]|uniref:HCP-like protein n=1 Tax=Chaetoceros tenuissimus TaxID=426638 RepID=A0AAD3CKP5_9STRA|nr:HCP-like protein [Chaetoceros tenuissimus]
MSAQSSSTSVLPSLPPLHFIEDDKRTFPLLCSELETNIFSYLDWGDYARLSTVHSSLSHIVQDAADQSDEAKWTLVQSLLNGENGLAQNESLALKYLHELSGVQVRTETFDPTYEEVQAISPEDMDFATMAMKQIAECYLEGKGVDMDNTLGLAWLQQAYLHGDLEAAHNIAVIYEYGKYDVEVDIYLAAKWFHGSAKAGNVESMAEYAMCLELGCGVEQSDEQALEWYRKAAELGHATSNFSVGEWFECARGGLPQSDTEAVLWYFKAASMGDEDSKLALKRLHEIARIVVPGWASTLNV